MRIEFDAAADAAYIYLNDIGAGEVGKRSGGRTERASDGAIALDYDARGQLRGIEVQGATARLPREVLDGATAPGVVVSELASGADH